MEHIEKTVFLSYRRTNISWALAIFKDLTQHGYDVFLDYSGIASGDFERVILENIKARAHFLALLTPSALERCHDPADWLRREIEAALESQRNIVPVMLEEFDFGTPIMASQLTGKLAALKHYNGVRVPPDYCDAAMERLRDRYLNVPLTAVLHPASAAAQRAAREEKTAADAAPAVEDRELIAWQWLERGFTGSDDDDDPFRCYNEAIRLWPDFTEAFYYRGVLHAAFDDHEDAIQDYSEVIRLKPDSAEAFINRGNARHKKGDMEGAIQDYSEAIRLKPDSALAFSGRGDVRRKKGDFAGAIQDYSEVIRLWPEDDFLTRLDMRAEVFNNRGNMRYKKNDLDEAIQDYSEAIRLWPYSIEAFHNRGVARKAKGDLQGARQDFKEAERLRRPSGEVPKKTSFWRWR